MATPTVLSVFLTDLDTRAAVKGSRDPLGIQSVWTRFGRHVVGNLTTVSASVRDFTVTILGYYLVDRLRESLGSERDLATFLKWEQLAAYARGAINDDWEFRGTEKARRNLDDGEGRVRLSEQALDQILGNQKIYGLWGLYTAPSRASGLVIDDPVRLTPPAVELVEHFYLKVLRDGGLASLDPLLDLLSKDRADLHVQGRHATLLKSVAVLLKQTFSRQEREFYREHLLHGGPEDRTEGLQRQLAELLEPTLKVADVHWLDVIQHVIKDASARGPEWEGLAYRLDRIRTIESVLAPSSYLFSYLLGCDGQSLDEVSGLIDDAWGNHVPRIDPGELELLRPELDLALPDSGDRWHRLGASLSSGNYAEAIELMLHQNSEVMAARGGAAAWIELADRRLRVRFHDDADQLPTRKELTSLWRFPYFIESLRTVASTLGVS